MNEQFCRSAQKGVIAVPTGIMLRDVTSERAERIGKRVEKARKARGWNMATLARRAKVSASYISRLEGGTYPNPSLAKMSAIADVLGVRVSDLVDLPPATPDELIEQIRALIGADLELFQAIVADLMARSPEDRPGALRFVLQGLTLTRNAASRN